MDNDVEVPLILGQPFLAITQALLDVSNERMILMIGNKSVVFALSDTMKLSLDSDDLYLYLDVTDSIVDEYM